jgi:hypothetical protein
MAVHDVDLEAIDIALDGPDLFAEPREIAIEESTLPHRSACPTRCLRAARLPRRYARPLALLEMLA